MIRSRRRIDHQIRRLMFSCLVDGFGVEVEVGFADGFWDGDGCSAL
jgi:hypothetical protein